MTLINCPECNTEISDKAEKCPKCGNPMRPALIEKTGKGWKLAKLISVIVFLLGLLFFSHILGKDGWNDPLTGLGFCLAFVGFVALMVSMFGAWWNHR